jgi:hypothetical protein
METPKKSLQEVLKRFSNAFTGLGSGGLGAKGELEAIEERMLDEEVDRLLALSDAELDRELEKAGLNPEEVRAGASEILEKAMRLQVKGLAGAPRYPKSSGSGPAL